jgi:hypothetical protein
MCLVRLAETSWIEKMPGRLDDIAGKMSVPLGDAVASVIKFG